MKTILVLQKLKFSYYSAWSMDFYYFLSYCENHLDELPLAPKTNQRNHRKKPTHSITPSSIVQSLSIAAQ